MNNIGQPERVTQNRVITLFRDELHYRYLGDWTDRDGNSNIEEGLLTDYLSKSGCTPAQISVATHKLRTEADNHSRGLYGNNFAVYNLLRYGVPVKIEAGKVTETVHIIDWREPEKNDFAIAEEVTLKGIPFEKGKMGRIMANGDSRLPDRSCSEHCHSDQAAKASNVKEQCQPTRSWALPKATS